MHTPCATRDAAGCRSFRTSRTSRTKSHCSGASRAKLETFLAAQIEAGLVVDGVIAASAAQAGNIWRIRDGMTEAQGYEGGVAKDLESRYELGRRSGAWFKLKPAITLDLAVTGALYSTSEQTRGASFGTWHMRAPPARSAA